MKHDRGVTLIEMMMVVMLFSLLAAISYPSITAGLDSVRLVSAADSVVSFLNYGLTHAERRQLPVELAIDKNDATLRMTSPEPGFQRRLQMPDTIRIQAILPELPQDTDAQQPRRFLLLPGGTVPRLGVVLANGRGTLKTVRVDPITGAPQVTTSVAAAGSPK